MTVIIIIVVVVVVGTATVAPGVSRVLSVVVHVGYNLGLVKEVGAGGV
jgi:hypothetical protein